MAPRIRQRTPEYECGHREHRACAYSIIVERCYTAREVALSLGRQERAHEHGDRLAAKASKPSRIMPMPSGNGSTFFSRLRRGVSPLPFLLFLSSGFLPQRIGLDDRPQLYRRTVSRRHLHACGCDRRDRCSRGSERRRKGRFVSGWFEKEPCHERDRPHRPC